MKKAILISGFSMVETRLLPIKRIIEDRYSAEIYVSDFIHQTKRYKEGRREDYNYIHVKAYKNNLSLNRIMSHLGFSKEIYKILKREKPDLVYSRIPFNSLALYIMRYKKYYNPSCQVVFDIIDLWPESMPHKGLVTYIPFMCWKNMRDKSLKNASHVFLECNYYYEALKDYLPNSWSSLYLYKEESTIAKQAIEEIIMHSKFGDGDCLTLCYLGSINHIIDLQGIEKVVSILSDAYKIVVKIIGVGESKQDLITILEQAGAEVNYYGEIYDEEEKIRILAPCDFGINMMVEDVKVGLTTKSIDYLEYGIPLINNIKGDTWNLIEQNGGGINICSSINLLERVKIIKNDPARTHQQARTIFLKHLTKEAFQKTIERVFEQL